MPEGDGLQCNLGGDSLYDALEGDETRRGNTDLVLAVARDSLQWHRVHHSVTEKQSTFGARVVTMADTPDVLWFKVWRETSPLRAQM